MHAVQTDSKHSWECTSKLVPVLQLQIVIVVTALSGMQSRLIARIRYSEDKLFGLGSSHQTMRLLAPAAARQSLRCSTHFESWDGSPLAVIAACSPKPG